MPNMTLVRTMRILTCGAAHRAGLVRAMLDSGAHPGSIVKIVGFLSSINRYARRQLLLSAPCASTLTADEAALLGLICASQNRQADEFEARARWLVREDGLADVRWQTDDLAASLAIDGIFLEPLPMAPVSVRQPALPVLEAVTPRSAAMT